MEVNLNDNVKEAKTSVSFARDWLISREVVPMKHDKEWDRFAEILAQ